MCICQQASQLRPGRHIFLVVRMLLKLLHSTLQQLLHLHTAHILFQDAAQASALQLAATLAFAHSTHVVSGCCSSFCTPPCSNSCICTQHTVYFSYTLHSGVCSQLSGWCSSFYTPPHSNSCICTQHTFFQLYFLQSGVPWAARYTWLLIKLTPKGVVLFTLILQSGVCSQL